MKEQESQCRNERTWEWEKVLLSPYQRETQYIQVLIRLSYFIILVINIALF